MYIVKSVIAIRGIENDAEAEIIESFREAIQGKFGKHQLTEVLVECKEEIAGERS